MNDFNQWIDNLADEPKEVYPDTMPQGFWFDADGAALFDYGLLGNRTNPDFEQMQKLGFENQCRFLRGTMIRQWGPLSVKQINQKDAKAFIDANHRHHPAPRGWKFGLAISDLVSVVGVIWVGRPNARALDDGTVLEVTRVCLLKACVKNVPSMLYGKAARIAKDLGYKRIITYTLLDEDGTSIKASGWDYDGVFGGRSWDTPSRHRDNKAPTGRKHRWSKILQISKQPRT